MSVRLQLPVLLLTALLAWACQDDPPPGNSPPDATSPGPQPECGNGLKEAGEACDDGNLLAGDGCSPQCATEACRDSAECDDGLFCNGAEVCGVDGRCAAGAPPTADDGLACTISRCDEASDAVVHDPLDSLCDDGDACTADVCQPGVGCTHANTCECRSTADCDDGNPCTDDDCSPAHVCANTANSASCDDGLFCTGADHCRDGACAPGADPCVEGPTCARSCDEVRDTCNLPANAPCEDDSNPCTDDLCDGSGACTHPDNAAPCDDLVFCNGGDTCAAGGCSVHAGDPCAAGPECADHCDEAGRTCASPTMTPCSDEGNLCTDDLCDGEGACQHPFNNQPCDDGLFCNGPDLCEAGVCGAHAGDPCAAGAECEATCNEAAETCHAPALTPCSDDGDLCTDDRCDGAGTCSHPSSAARCDDGVFCNGPERCDAEVGCVPGSPPPLDDAIACTVDRCDESLDLVTHTPDDGLCDDGLWCNGRERCQATLGCQPGAAPVVSDGVACTIDACDEAADVVTHLPDDSACDDLQWCNGDETCEPVAGCRAGTSRVDDGIACTTDSCDERTRTVQHVASDGSCDDGEACNGAETCSASLGCRPGAPLRAGDSCDGELSCRTDERCDGAGKCDPASGTPVVCADNGDFCTDPVCSESAQGCTTAPHAFKITGHWYANYTACSVAVRNGIDFSYDVTCASPNIELGYCYGGFHRCVLYGNGAVQAQIDRPPSRPMVGAVVSSGCSYASTYGASVRCCMP